MTTVTIEDSVPSVTVASPSPQISMGTQIVFAQVVDEDSVNLVVQNNEIDVAIEDSNAVEITVSQTPIEITVSPGTSGGGANINGVLVSLRWDTPSTESGNTIEIIGEFLSYDGTPLVSSLPSVQIVVSDGANDAEPSHTATLTAANTPVGTVLAGSGTATLTIRANLGMISVAVHETAVAHRFLWVQSARHERLWVRAEDGVQELIFS